MKLALSLGIAAAFMALAPAHAQVTVYGQFSASKLTNLVRTDVLYGPTVGVTAEFFKGHRLRLGADLRGSFVGGQRRLDGIAFGPRLATSVKHFDPYIELLVGYARFNDGLGNANSATTDAQFQANVGLDRRLTPRFDIRLFEYSYEEYFALGGQFNPKTFSSGVVYHFNKR